MSESLLTKILTVSDGVAAGTRQDTSSQALADRLELAGFEVVERRVVPDGIESVRDAIIDLAEGFAGLVLTTGGTGFGPRDLTPEGTTEAVERSAPGLAEAIRIASNGAGRSLGMLSRGIAGTRGMSLIVNTPGSTTGAVEAFEAVEPVLGHALELLRGARPH